jgi:cytoplasmic iron level regulating protein YaaA (DUF328/UPF0246 family)
VIRTRATHVGQLETFDAEGYALDHGESQPDRLVFRRSAPN